LSADAVVVPEIIIPFTLILQPVVLIVVSKVTPRVCIFEITTGARVELEIKSVETILGIVEDVVVEVDLTKLVSLDI
jgi:hypothetical protein